MDQNCRNCGGNSLTNYICDYCGTTFISKFKSNNNHLLNNIGCIVEDPTKFVKLEFYEPGLRNPYKIN